MKDRDFVLRHEALNRISAAHDKLFIQSQKNFFFCDDLKAAFILAVVAELKTTLWFSRERNELALVHQEVIKFAAALPLMKLKMNFFRRSYSDNTESVRSLNALLEKANEIKKDNNNERIVTYRGINLRTSWE